MSDQNPDRPVPDAAHQPTDPATTPDRSGRLGRWRTGLRERAGRTSKGVALAVAGALLVGGVGGFAVGALAVGDRADGFGDRSRDDWPGHPADGPGEDRPAPPAGVPGQLPPATDEDGGGLDG